MFATTTTNLRRFTAAILAAALAAVLVGMTPAAANAPAEFSYSDSFTAVNPCTNEVHDITINVDVREHIHDGRIVGHASRTGSTSDGYVMNNGLENFVFNGNVVSGTFRDTWRNADGSMFKAESRFLAGEDGIVIDNFRLRCVRG